MSTPLTPNNTGPLIRLADHVAHRLCRKACLSLQEKDDLRQDLLLDLLTRLKFYDASRCSIAGFATVCFWHRADRLAARVRRERQHRHRLSLDDVLPDTDGLTLAATLSEADGYSVWCGQPTDAFAAVERSLDLDDALGTLPDDALPLCAALTERTPHELAEAGYAPRTSLYRRLHALRLELLPAGISPEWNGSAPAWVEV